MKIAQYKSVEHGYLSICDAETFDRVPEYIRVSEHVEVEFPALPPEDLVAQEVEALDKVRANVVEEFCDKLAIIDRRKSELLALTVQA